MADRGEPDEFDIVYRDAGVYDEVLPSYRFDGVEDVGLVTRLLEDVLSDASVLTRRALDLGCGAGRMTRVLAAHASATHAVDSSASMLRALSASLPTVTTTCADVRDALRDNVANGRRFDLVGSFWSMNYPLLACFEDMTARGVSPRPDPAAGLEQARRTVADLVEVLAPGGHLMMLFFDAESPEQRFVTRLWERIAPFPGSGRDVTWQVLRSGLENAQHSGLGRLRLDRRAGHAVSRTAADALRWFLLGHLNGLPALVQDPGVVAEVAEFVAAYRRSDGSVAIPASVHMVHFQHGSC